jgi:hypothetical protein
MSKKKNIVTLRTIQIPVHYTNFDSKSFLITYNFLAKFKQLLRFKKILLSKHTINISVNKLSLSLYIYYKTIKLKLFRKKRVKQSLTKKKIITLRNNPHFLKLFKNTLLILKQNNIEYKIIVLNKNLKKSFITYLSKKLKQYTRTLFNRKWGSYVDFLNISSLYFSGKINFDPLGTILVDLFKYTHKRNHSKYFIFVRRLFKLLTSSLKKKFKGKSDLIGIKFIIKGRLKGKPRANKYSINIGKVPVQSLGENIEFFKLHANTNHYGTFGFKCWVLRKRNNSYVTGTKKI